VEGGADLSRLPLGARLFASLRIDTEDGASFAQIDRTAVSFVIESCHELDVCNWEVKEGVLRVELLLPTHTCATELLAIYTETRDEYKPKPSDIESNRVSIEVVAGPVDHISLQTKKGSDSLTAAEQQLVLPTMMVCALDAHNNKSSSLPGGAALACSIVPEIESDKGELALHGDAVFPLSAATNPVTLKGVCMLSPALSAISYASYLPPASLQPSLPQKTCGLSVATGPPSISASLPSSSAWSPRP